MVRGALRGREGARVARRWLRETAGGLPATFWYLWCGTLVNRAGAFVVIFLALYLTAARGFSASYAGLVIGLFGAGGAVGVLVGGVLADRWGRRATLLTAHLSTAGCLIGLGLARDQVAIAVFAAALGASGDMARPAFQAMMVDVVAPADRLRAFSLNYWAINLGFATASMLAGLVAQLDYLLLFVVDAATTVVTALIIFTKVRETRPVTPPAAPDAARPGRTPGSVRIILRDRVFLTFVGLNAASALIFMQHISTLPIAMRQDGLTPATFGFVIALNGVLIVVGQLFVPRLVGARDRSRMLAVASVVIGVGFGLTALADSVWMYAVCVLVWTLGEMLQSPSNATLMAELAPASLRGRYQGMFSLSFAVAAFGAPVMGGYVLQRFGDTALWLGCLALGLLVAAAHLASRRARSAGLNSRLAAGPEGGSAYGTPHAAPASDT